MHPPWPECSSRFSSTYIATSRDMFDIVLGATTRRDMAEVQLFVHYLNLKTGRHTHRQAREWGNRKGKRRHRKEKKKNMTGRQSSTEEQIRWQLNLTETEGPWSVCMEDILSFKTDESFYTNMNSLIVCRIAIYLHQNFCTVKKKGLGNYVTKSLWFKKTVQVNWQIIKSNVSEVPNDEETEWIRTESFHKQD